jgi:hypothetical protein
MRILKSIYNFLCGDPFILVTTLVSFVVSGLLVSVVRAPNIIVVTVFVGLIVAGLVLALGRERHAGKR